MRGFVKTLLIRLMRLENRVEMVDKNLIKTKEQGEQIVTTRCREKNTQLSLL